MMFAYILESEKEPGRYYTGLAEDVRKRLLKHNAGDVKHTSKYKPWRIKNYFWFDEVEKARQFEKYLKSGSGRAFAKKHF
ncbi:GIY-YIG nuclease family protein [bacterium]|nr:GIY-YIG nuclease family protein [bacterium]